MRVRVRVRFKVVVGTDTVVVHHPLDCRVEVERLRLVLQEKNTARSCKLELSLLFFGGARWL